MPGRDSFCSDDERRGQPLLYASYWSHQRRLVRKEVFQLQERGFGPAAISRELGLSRPEVEAILLTDRRRRSRAADAS